MPNEPQIDTLSYSKRKWFFVALCIVFVLMLPAMIFYTTGYRIDLDDSENRIVTTGGLYITTDNLEVDVYLDDEQIRRPRLFRSAYYIQDVESGLHRVVVQQNNLHTWVKELPVDPYLVIEVAAFNMPLQPQLRHIPPYTSAGSSVVPASASTSVFFAEATTTDSVFFATSTATTTYVVNTEYAFVDSLFSTSTASSTSLVERFMATVEQFGFATTSESAATSTARLVPTKGNISLIEKDSDVFAVWTGSANAVPYYFCVTNATSTMIAERYGSHVAEQIDLQRLSTTTPVYQDENRICRFEIRIDRKRQDVLFYDFLPGSSDLVLLQLEDGLYVTEIDDRAWQNTQQIFPGTDFSVRVENDIIYIKQDDLFAELLTRLPEE